jgi:hypothetical protein
VRSEWVRASRPGACEGSAPSYELTARRRRMSHRSMRSSPRLPTALAILLLGGDAGCDAPNTGRPSSSKARRTATATFGPTSGWRATSVCVDRLLATEGRGPGGRTRARRSAPRGSPSRTEIATMKASVTMRSPLGPSPIRRAAEEDCLRAGSGCSGRSAAPTDAANRQCSECLPLAARSIWRVRPNLCQAVWRL